MFRLIVFLMLASLTSCGWAQSDKKGSDRTLTTADGWPIHITYFKGQGKQSPVVVLVAAAEGPQNSQARTRKVWNNAALALNRAGFAVVTVDLRKHGDSMPAVEKDQLEKLSKIQPRDYALMAGQDLETVKGFLVAEHEKEQLNIRKLGIASAGSSCIVSAAFAALDWGKAPWHDNRVMALRTPKGQDVRALLMLDPKSSVRGMRSADIFKNLADPRKGIAVNIYYNPGNSANKRSADTLFKYLKLKNADDEDARKVIKSPKGKAYEGEGLLVGKFQTTIEKEIVTFFKKYVDGREDPWKSRISPLQQ